MWFQYVIGYDKQETALRWSPRCVKSLMDFQDSISRIDRARSLSFVIKPILIGLASLTSLVNGSLSNAPRTASWLATRLRVWGFCNDGEHARVDFYERLLTILASRGLTREAHQTPLNSAALAGGRRSRTDNFRLQPREIRAISRSPLWKIILLNRHSPGSRRALRE